MNTFEQMIDLHHERVCFHTDEASGLRAIVAIHSTTLGNALGGTRRWHYATEADAIYDVLRLSHGMTCKAACAGLPMGGAKSIIWIPKPAHPPTEAEARAMGRFVGTFHGEYIAAEDVGVDPQYCDWMAMETNHVMGGDRLSKGGDPSPYTAHGVFNAMKACLGHLGMPISFDGLTVAIRGLGHVGYKLAQLLRDGGATVMGADIRHDIMERASKELGVVVADDDEILTAKCDILAPCALGGIINATNAQKLRCKVICGGANNQLGDPDEDAVLLKNRGILYAPDFVVNSGGLIELAGIYLGMSRPELDQKNADIEGTTARILELGESMPSTYAAAIAVARERITAGDKEKAHAG
jgi:leucine dehydrogenase